jgi:hypothetical protein
MRTTAVVQMSQAITRNLQSWALRASICSQRSKGDSSSMTIVRISILHQEPLCALTTTSASPCSALYSFRHMLVGWPFTMCCLCLAHQGTSLCSRLHLSFSRKPFSLEHMHIYGADTPPPLTPDGYSSFFAGRNDANPATHTFVTSPDIVTAMASTGDTFQGPCRRLASHFRMLFLGGIKVRGPPVAIFLYVGVRVLTVSQSEPYLYLV